MSEEVKNQANEIYKEEAILKASENLSQLGRSFAVTAESLNKASEIFAELGKALEPYSKEEIETRFKGKRYRWLIALVVLIICITIGLLLL